MSNTRTMGTAPAIRTLQADEVEATSGAFLPIIIAVELFALGFEGGVIACNVANGRPWYEF